MVAKMKKKSYKITFELREGYKPNAKEHSLQDATNAIKVWLEERLAQNAPVVNGLLQEGSLLYPSKEDETKATAAKCAIYTGELSTKEDVRRKNKEVKKTLEALASSLKTQLNQRSVFIIYKNKNWCI